MKNRLFLKLWILFKIETTNFYVRNCHICRKSFLEIMKLTNKWLMELFLQADDPNYFSCFKFMCHNHHNQLCLMILRHESASLRYLFITQWREIISEFGFLDSPTFSRDIFSIFVIYVHIFIHRVVRQWWIIWKPPGRGGFQQVSGRFSNFLSVQVRPSMMWFFDTCCRGTRCWFLKSPGWLGQNMAFPDPLIDSLPAR